MGTPAFAVPALRGLLESQHTVVGVYSQPARPAGRGKQLTPSPVQVLAEEYSIPIHTPFNFKEAGALDTLRAIGADIAVVAAYGLILPEAVLQAFPHGCINIHPSALPRWRGAAPIHRTVLAGDTETEICIMQMDKGLDSGAVLAREHIPLPPGITSSTLHDILAEQSVAVLLETLEAIENGSATAEPQTEAGLTYAAKIRKEEAQIDWNRPAQDIERQVRGLNSYPVANTICNGETLKIWEADIIPYTGNAIPGTVLDEQCTIACAKDALRPTLVQRPGKKPMPITECLRGFAIPTGTVMGH